MVGHRERQRAADALDRQHLVLLGDVGRDEAQGLRVDVDVRQRDGGNAVLPREEADQLLFGEGALTDQDGAELVRLAPLVTKRLAQLRVGDEPLGDEEVAQTPHHLLPELHLSH
jgi:hypothetical protein